MALELLWVIIGIGIGAAIAWYIISQQKWGDKAKILDSKWKRQVAEAEKAYEIRLEKNQTSIEKLKEQSKKEIAELEKKYEVKIEKMQTSIEKIIEANKTSLEKNEKEWAVKYTKDIEELKRLFKESEKIIKQKSVASSRRSLVGKFIERFVPFLSKIEYAPSDMHFMGQPVDYVVFDGLRNDKIEKVIFLEVKTGESKLTKREKSLKDTISKKKVYWKEIRVDTKENKTPDHKIAIADSSIDELYDKIDDKLKNVKAKTATSATKRLQKKEVGEEYNITCPECENEILVELSKKEIKDLKNGEEIEIECSECKKHIVLDEFALEEDAEDYAVTCPKCEEEFTVELDSDDDLDEGVKTKCPNCKKPVTIHEKDIVV